MKDSIFAGIAVSAGTKRKAHIEVGSDPLGGCQLPLWIARAKNDGPTFGIVAGIHGCEYPSILAAAEFFEQLDLREMTRGTIAVVPIANPYALVSRTPFVCPVDDINLNRVFPGDMSGSFSLRLAAVLFDEVLSKCDYVVDLHCGDYFERLLLHTKYYVSGREEVDRKSEHLAKLFTERFYQPVSGRRSGGLFVEVAKSGIPSIIVEAGGEGFLNRKSVEIHKNGIREALRWVGIFADDPKAKRGDGHYEEVVEEVGVRTDKGGFLLSEKGIGDQVRKGEKIATIKDLESKSVAELISPIDGIVMLVNSRGVVTTGETVFLIWATKQVKSE